MARILNKYEPVTARSPEDADVEGLALEKAGQPGEQHNVVLGPAAVSMPPRSRMSSSDQPRSLSRPAACCFAAGSSPDRNTELGGITPGFTIVVIAAVFIDLTTRASGRAACRCSARLSLG